eukprot:Gb_36742 [translate_table: standard]
MSNLSPKFVHVSARIVRSVSATPMTSTNWDKEIAGGACFTEICWPSEVWPRRIPPSLRTTLRTHRTLLPMYLLITSPFTITAGLEVSIWK